MGIIVTVYRDAEGDTTLGGISSTANRLCLVNVDGPFTPDHRTPAALLVAGYPGTVKIVPAIVEGDGIGWATPVHGWYMAGGNFAYTPDSRFSEACRKLCGHEFYGAVPIHDRHE